MKGTGKLLSSSRAFEGWLCSTFRAMEVRQFLCGRWFGGEGKGIGAARLKVRVVHAEFALLRAVVSDAAYRVQLLWIGAGGGGGVAGKEGMGGGGRGGRGGRM